MLIQIDGEVQLFLRVWLWPHNYVGDEHCGLLPDAGLPSFWRTIGVDEDREEALEVEWKKGNILPIAPQYPVLSSLIHVQLDNVAIQSEQVPFLLNEIESCRGNCNESLGLEVFSTLEGCAVLAMTHATGLMISPF